MGFLGIKGDTWKKIGKIALKVAPIAAAPFTGGASLLALGAGTGALSGYLGGGGLKGALLGGGLGAIPGFGGAGGATAGTAAKVGVKQLATGLAKGAAQNFGVGTATGLATGQGVKGALKSGGASALSGAGSTGAAGGLKGALTTGAKQVGLNAGTQFGTQALQKAGVPGAGAIAGQGANVFSNYLGGNSFVDPQRGSFGGFLPQSPQAAPAGGASSWKQRLLQTGINAGTGAIQGAQQGGGVRGALTGATTSLTGQGGGGGTGMARPMSFGGGDTTSVGAPGTGPLNMPIGLGRTASTGPYNPSGAVNSTGGPQSPPVFRGGVNQALPTAAAPGAATAPTGAPTGAQNQGGAGQPSGWGKWGPVATQAGGLILGGWAGQKATEMAQTRSPEEQAALRGAQGVAGQAGQLGGDLARSGQQYQQGPANYFQTLLSGNRAAMSQMVAPAVAQITGNYRGAERNLEHAGIRGAARDVAAGDLNRQRVSQIAGLTTGVQPAAAEALAKMGEGNIAQAGGLYSTSGQLQNDLLRQGMENRKYAREEGGKTGAAIGGLVRDVGEVAFGGKGQPTAKGQVPKGKKLPVGGQSPTDILGGTHTSVGGIGPAPLPVGGQTPGQILGGSPGSSVGPLGQAPVPFSMGNQPQVPWINY